MEISIASLLNAFPGYAGVVSLSGNVVAASESLRKAGVIENMDAMSMLSGTRLSAYAELLKAVVTEGRIFREVEDGEKTWSLYAGREEDAVVFWAYDKTELGERISALISEASFDPLTKLFNRRRFYADAERLMAMRIPDMPPFFIEMDIDHFKHVNDTYGHDAGDDVLVEAAVRIKSCLRTGDILARGGGEEFWVLGRCHEVGEALAVAERIRAAVKASPITARDGTDIPVTISLGCDFAGGRQSPDVEELLSNADLALYWSKDHGRDQATLYGEHMRSKTKE